MKEYLEMFLGLALGILAMTFYYTANAKERCVVIDGEVYCKKIQEIKVGKVNLEVVDPNILFASAKESKLEKLGLWKKYKYPKFIRELAKQNNMTPQELIDLLAKEDPNWAALKKLEEIYPDLALAYNDYSIQLSMQDIMKQIVKDILRQIKYAI